MTQRVAVIGAGFGGLAVARELGGHDEVEVTVVDRHNYHTFNPLLYQVATAGLNTADVAFPLRAIFRRHRNVTFRRANVDGVDWERRELLVSEGPPLAFDHLIVAAGGVTNTFGVPGADGALPLVSLTDAVSLRNQVLTRFEQAAAAPSGIADGDLTFVVVGGGPTGVEVSGALVELFDKVLRKDFPRLDISRAHVVLVEMRDDLLNEFAVSSRRHARDTLCGRGVEVRTGEAVARVTADGLHLASGEVIAARTVIWAAGIRANPLAELLGVPTGRAGRIDVDAELRMPGRERAYAIGDVANVSSDGAVLAQVAQVAMQSGRHAARQVLRSVAGRALVPFRYRNKGTMATIGRRAAVAELPLGIKLRGTLGWLAWLGLHLVYLVGFRNRISVFLNWGWNYLTWDRGPRLILDRADGAAAPGASGVEGDITAR